MKPDTDVSGRMLVVGASSGIGRALAVQAAASGWRVALAARRVELLGEAVSEIGRDRAFALACDVTDAGASRALAGRASEALGGLDVLVYAAGAARLGAVSRTSALEWDSTMSTNVVGAAMAVAGALEHLRASPARPTAVFLSTHSVPRPWPGLVVYAASKAALDALARGLRAEEPWLRVVDVAIGDTATGFADSWDPRSAGEFFERWVAEGYLRHRIFGVTEVARALLGIVEQPDGSDDVVLLGEELPPAGT